MPISDLFGLLTKRQTSPDKYLASSVNVVSAGQYGAMRAPFSQNAGINAYRSWVYAASSINANAVASLPLRLYAKKDETPFRTRSISKSRRQYLNGDGANHPSNGVIRKAAMFGDDFEEVTDSHPITDLLGSANPYLNGFDLTVLRVLYGELTGNAYLHPVISEATGYPEELWPLAPHYVEVIPDEDEFVRGYVYGIDSTRKQIFEPDEIIHFRRPNPGNLFYGMGKVEAAFGVVQANQAVHEMDLATFSNMARPDYAVVVKGTPTGDQLDRFQQQVENRLRGTRKDGSFITVTGDVQFTPLNFPPKDLAGREEIVEEIAAVFGVPVTMLKANDPNLASAQTGFAQWREGTVLPLCRMDEQELNQTLLPLFDLEETHCLAYDNPVPTDKAFELQERQTAVAGGWRTPNEARQEEGREPIEDEIGDKLYVNGQELGKEIEAGILPALPSGGFDSEIEPEEVEEVEEVQEVEPATPQPAEGVAGLNGAQVQAVVDVLDRVALGSVSAIAGVELVVAVGLNREQAERMVNSQLQVKPAAEAEAEIEADTTPTKALTLMSRTEDDLYETAAEAEAVAAVLGCSGHHTHDVDGRTMYMPCDEMSDYSEITGQEHASDDDPSLIDSKAIEDVDLKPTEEMAEFAARGLELREEHGRGGTEVGVARARDIKNRSNLSPETVGRMANFFGRHRVDLDAPAADPSHDEYPSAGVIAWMLWGGDPNNPDDAGNGWSERKLEEIESAREKAKDDASTPAEPSERIEGSDANKPGSASGSRGGIEISEETEKALKNKVEQHNEKHGDTKSKKVNLGMLKAVYRRGAGAFSTSHRPGMTRNQWSMGRVNAFLYLVRNGRPENAKYTSDNDLLPEGHPKKTDKKSCDCCNEKSLESKVYEWPEETKMLRLNIEGLADDFKRLKVKAPDEAVDADEDIREEEKATPAMQIARVTEEALSKVQKRLELALKSGEINRANVKSLNKSAIEKILKDLGGVSNVTRESLIAALTKAFEGGQGAGVSRLNQILSGRGAGRINQTPAMSDALVRSIAKRAEQLTKAIVEDTVVRFTTKIEADFSVADEINRLSESGDLSRGRAETIARTESARGYHEGQIDTWKQTGLVKRKRFLKAPGACQYCEAVDKMFGAKGESVDIDQPMIRKGQKIAGTEGGTMEVGLDSSGTVHPNCRCDIIAELD